MSSEAAKKDFWSADTYGVKVAPFVAQKTEKVVGWLNPQADDVILDIGAGEGVLTARLQGQVSFIGAIDGSANMIKAMQTTFPNIASAVVDCSSPSTFAPSSSPFPPTPAPSLAPSSLLVSGAYTALFSNAALHWILRAEAGREPFFRTCAALLRPGGRFVSESGAIGNVAEIHAVVWHELLYGGHVSAATGAPLARDEVMAADPWFFPSVERMRALAESAGLVWVRGEIEARQTTITSEHEGGVKGWIRLFCNPFAGLLKGGSEGDEWAAAVDKMAQSLERVGRRTEDGQFQVNYMRLRFEVRKPEA